MQLLELFSQDPFHQQEFHLNQLHVRFVTIPNQLIDLEEILERINFNKIFLQGLSDPTNNFGCRD